MTMILLGPIQQDVAIRFVVPHPSRDETAVRIGHPRYVFGLSTGILNANFKTGSS